MNITHFPTPVQTVIDTLEKSHFDAFVVGGSLRDLLLGKSPRDWDITTNARPEDIQRLFPDSVYENTFGTVGIKVPRFLPETPASEEHDMIEVTTYRIESDYTDARHPDKIQFVDSLEQDLSRRDFTVNALAGRFEQGNFVLTDPFGGKEDLDRHILRAVGPAQERFQEDALRLIRAVRLITELGSEWIIETETLEAIKALTPHLSAVAKERVRDEFSRIVLAEDPVRGLTLLLETGLLKEIIPELVEGVGVTQNLHHIYTVWEHNLRALATVPSQKLSVRIAALLHDVGKPRTKRGEGYRSTFYNHDHVGARMARQILERLRYPKKVIEHAVLLVDNHLFYYNVGEVTEASVRRLIRRVGLENMDDLMAVRIGDRLGSGVPKAKPYKLRHLEYMIDKVSHDPTSVKMLKVDGALLMQTLDLKPGPKIGALLNCLLAEVIEDPKKNEASLLLDRARELRDNDLGVLQSLAKERIEEERESEDRSLKGRHRVA